MLVLMFDGGCDDIAPVAASGDDLDALMRKAAEHAASIGRSVGSWTSPTWMDDNQISMADVDPIGGYTIESVEEV